MINKPRLVGFLTGVVGPLPNGHSMTYKWGVLATCYLLSGMILQVVDAISAENVDASEIRQ